MAEFPTLNPWSAICPTCGSKPSQACYGNGPMPKSMTHPARLTLVHEAAHAAHDTEVRMDEREKVAAELIAYPSASNHVLHVSTAIRIARGATS